jgi:predicted Zn-ribbon and HTH transcriptional regulator
MKQLPPLADQIASLMADTKKIFDESGINDILSTAELVEQRLKICGMCEHWHGSRCMKCGCFMETKARFKALKCPIGKW